MSNLKASKFSCKCGKIVKVESYHEIIQRKKLCPECTAKTLRRESSKHRQRIKHFKGV